MHQGVATDISVALVFEFSKVLAKSFLVLGDSFADQEEFKQAKATFESIRDGYEGEDDILEAVRMRLEKLEEINKNE